LVGAAAGLVAGMLTAPKSGKETRADIKAKAAELKGEAATRANEVKDASTKAVKEVKGKAEDYKERGERAVEGAIEGAKKGFFSKK
ncbi:MAG TPA: YtxH domain-containing protein, partial [Candidatus Saccharimonadales bacterium]